MKWSLGKAKKEVRKPERKLTVFKVTLSQVVVVEGKVIVRFKVYIYIFFHSDYSFPDWSALIFFF